MLDLITGRPGSGKSYEATAFHILPALEAGRTVVTNMPLNVSEFSKLNPLFSEQIIILQPSADNLRPFSVIEDYTRYEKMHSPDGEGVLFVIDEAHMAIGGTNKDVAREVREWYALHRHVVADVLIMTQSVRKLNKEILDMVRFHIGLSKNDALGMRNHYRRYVRDGVNGSLTGKGLSIRYDKRFFPLYQTHTGKSGKETSSNESTIWSHWVFRYALPLAAIACIWSISRVDFGLFSGPKPPPASVVSSGPASLQPPPSFNLKPPPVPDVPQDDDFPLKGSVFLISGFIKVGSSSHYFITARQPDGRLVKTSLADLVAMGYSVGNASPCYISLNYRQPSGSFSRNYATCGKVEDLPPIYYSDPFKGGASPIGAADAATSVLSSGLGAARPPVVHKPQALPASSQAPLVSSSPPSISVY